MGPDAAERATSTPQNKFMNVKLEIRKEYAQKIAERMLSNPYDRPPTEEEVVAIELLLVEFLNRLLLEEIS